jgi:hypothetical protein
VSEGARAVGPDEVVVGRSKGEGGKGVRRSGGGCREATSARPSGLLLYAGIRGDISGGGLFEASCRVGLGDGDCPLPNLRRVLIWPSDARLPRAGEVFDGHASVRGRCWVCVNDG